MTERKDDGGPAFHHTWGVTKRDYIAVQSMVPLITVMCNGDLNKKADETLAQAVARQAYVMADAMLAERAKK